MGIVVKFKVMAGKVKEAKSSVDKIIILITTVGKVMNVMVMEVKATMGKAMMVKVTKLKVMKVKVMKVNLLHMNCNPYGSA